MKRIGWFLVLVMVCLVGVFALQMAGDVVRRDAVNAKADLVRAQADAERAEAERVREEYEGRAELTIAQSYARVSESNNDALILIATEDVRARDSQRMFRMAVIMVAVVMAVFFAVSFYGRSFSDSIIAKVR